MQCLVLVMSRRREATRFRRSRVHRVRRVRRRPSVAPGGVLAAQESHAAGHSERISFLLPCVIEV